MKKVRFVVIATLLLIVLASCVSKKEIIYFQNDSIEQSKVSNAYKITFKPDDLLQITVSALDAEAAKPFNLPAVSYATTSNSVVGTPKQQSYLIDDEGYVEFPMLGKLKLGGLTRPEAIDLLKNKLDPHYIKNPTINIRISNFTITVLGNVSKPGTFNIPNERITVLEAIGLAGDLKISGVRTIKVFREENGKKSEYLLDLRSNKIFTSSVYYLQQNDVVYIEPNKASFQSASYNQNSSLFVALAGMIISIITLIK